MGTVRKITIEARREPLEIDPAGTAVVVVDMQNYVGSKGGMFDRVVKDISVIQKVVEPTEKSWLLRAGRT